MSSEDDNNLETFEPNSLFGNDNTSNFMGDSTDSPNTKPLDIPLTNSQTKTQTTEDYVPFGGYKPTESYKPKKYSLPKISNEFILMIVMFAAIMFVLYINGFFTYCISGFTSSPKKEVKFSEYNEIRYI